MPKKENKYEYHETYIGKGTFTEDIVIADIWEEDDWEEMTKEQRHDALYEYLEEIAEDYLSLEIELDET